VAEKKQTSEREERLREQRLALPDGPGVYLFKNADDEVIYVGKSLSLRKRVSSHFSSPVTRGGVRMVDSIEAIDFILLSSDAEALLTEQTLITRHEPRFNIQLRDDKSYPFIAVSTDEQYPRIYLTRERRRSGRVYFGPYSNPRRARSTVEVLQKVFQIRSCRDPEPGRRTGSPCLDYHIERCEAPCVGYVTEEHYAKNVDGVIAFLSGNYREIEDQLEARMKAAAAAHEYERAAAERNRLSAIRSLLESQGVGNEAAGSFDAIAVAADGTEANAQVFQVRDGVLADRQSFYLENPGELQGGEVAAEFIAQYYSGRPGVPAQIIVQQEFAQSERGALAEVLAERRGAGVEIRAAERGAKRRILELAQRNAALALDHERLRNEQTRRRRIEALDELQRELKLESLPMRIECFDISNLMGTHTVASMVVFESATPKKSDYRRFTIRSLEDGQPDDFAAMREVLERRINAWESQADLVAHDPAYNQSFATLPNLIVIDGGKGQLSAGLEVLDRFRERGVAVISLAKRIEEVFEPDQSAPLMLEPGSAGLQLLQRVRDEAHRFAIAHHRARRDGAMTASALDSVPGVGPKRKKALIKQFGSPEAVMAASREELEKVPGLPTKVANDLLHHMRRTGS
jgi:excinuclease ABC subunit C